jgi:hypothetical protein
MLISMMMNFIKSLISSITDRNGTKLKEEDIKKIQKNQRKWLHIYRNLANLEFTNWDSRGGNPYEQVVILLTTKIKKKGGASAYNSNTKLANAIAWLGRSDAYISKHKEMEDNTYRQSSDVAQPPTKLNTRYGNQRTFGYDLGKYVYLFDDGDSENIEWGNIYYYAPELLARDLDMARNQLQITGPVALLLSMTKVNTNLRFTLFSRGLTYPQAVPASAYFGYVLNGYQEALDELVEMLKPLLMKYSGAGTYLQLGGQNARKDDSRRYRYN